MKTLLIAALAGVFLFAGSATVSWFLMNQQKELVEETEETPVDESDPEQNIPPVVENIQKEKDMPVSMRPSNPITVESVMELSRSIRKTEQQLIEREKQIKKDRQGLNMMFEDLQRERSELTAFSNQVDSKLRALREVVEQLKVENEKSERYQRELANQEDSAKNATTNVSADLKQQVGVATKYLAAMDDTVVAGILKHAANKGDMVYAGLVLKSLDERKGGKVLAALEDPILVDQILKAAGLAE